MLDTEGLSDCKIIVSNSLDEYIIRDVILEGAKIDSFGVGERLITAKSEPVFGGVYKLSGLDMDGKMMPKIKLSENVEKITNPGFKKLYRFYSKETKKMLGDVITLFDETIDESKSYTIFDPNAIWKKKELTDYYVKDLRVQLFDKGKCIYESPDIEDIKAYCAGEIKTLWSETLRFENPQTYYVDLSKDLWEIKHDLINSYTK